MCGEGGGLERDWDREMEWRGCKLVYVCVRVRVCVCVMSVRVCVDAGEGER